MAIFAQSCSETLPEPVTLALEEISDRVDYNFDVQPILSEHCYACHGPDENTREGEFRLDVEQEALANLSEGRFAIVRGDPRHSEMLTRILSDDLEYLMPPPEEKLELSDHQKAVLYKWIDQGAEWKNHWSYLPPEKAQFPKIIQEEWPENAIDYFVLAGMERKGFMPSAGAEKQTLIRRLSLDLKGLPPTVQEVEEFLNDTSEYAHEKLVDRLLQSPHFGERWSWEWLDAARYADTNGFQGDPERKMWPWRDWVVNALNTNMPYDQFTIEQIGGDLISNASTDQILATAFNRNHTYNGEGGRIEEETRVENVFDRTETVGTLWLGMTFNCCRCHDHKFDQITQQEYYQFSDYFNQTSEGGMGRNGRVKPVLDLSEDLDRGEIVAIREFIKTRSNAVIAYEEEIFPRASGQPASESMAAAALNGDNSYALTFSPAERGSYLLGLLVNTFKDKDSRYASLLGKLRESLRKEDKLTSENLQVMVMDQLKYRRSTYVLDRGSYDKRGAPVSADVPAVLPAVEIENPANRLELAKWLVSSDHPLTARVTVNRFWQTLFGRGIVTTPDDFGIQGDKPTHPQLLDWLARDFIEHGWDVKRLIKQMVMSATYRQNSRISPELLEKDPDNRWLARAPRYRWPSWMLRDQALFVSGLMSDSIGGPSVKPYQPAGIWEEATFGFKKYEQDRGEDLYRRSLYVYWRRIVGPTMLFDNSARQICSVKPIRTNTPMHALTSLNDIAYLEAAHVMAAKVMKTRESDRGRIKLAFRMVTSRFPSDQELNILWKRWEALRREFKEDPVAAKKLIEIGEFENEENLPLAEHAAYATICSLMLNLDEVISKQ